VSKIEYNPPKSVTPFLLSNSFISLIVGPLGSTKTTAGIMKIAYHAAKMAKCHDGVRRSRAIWVRNTREQLRDTSIPDVLKWYKPGLFGEYEKTYGKFMLRFGDVECEIMFRGLDDADDVKKLLSLQASFGILDEFREINQDIFEALQGRLGRFPSKLENGVGCVTDDGEENKHLWGMSNPPDMDTFWEGYLSEPPNNAEVFFQPSGLSEEADWTEYLPANYYGNLMEGKSQDWIDVYIHAKFGKSLSGRPVFPSFNLDVHVAKSELRHVSSMLDTPLIIGHDFGLTPAAVIGQIYPGGRLLVLAEAVSEDMGVLRFIRERLKPLLASRFPNTRAIVIGDPAGAQRAQTDERTVFDILRAEGFRVVPAATNATVARIAAVDAFLNGYVDGKPRMLIDAKACPETVRALRGGYRYRVKRTGQADDRPDKNASSHIADALQYLCLYADGGRTFGSEMSTKAARREVKPIASRGWT
jgi:hypothetical protein